MFEKMYDKLFVPALICVMGAIGGILYQQGKADAIHEIYKRGMAVVDLNETKTNEK